MSADSDLVRDTMLRAYGYSSADAGALAALNRLEASEASVEQLKLGLRMEYSERKAAEKRLLNAEEALKIIIGFIAARHREGDIGYQPAIIARAAPKPPQ